jgi:alpha-N-arabinofuranosidase
MIQLLSSHRISTVLPLEDPSFGPAYYVAGYSNDTDSYILKTAVYNSTVPVNMSITFDGVSEGAEGSLIVLTAPELLSFNDVGSDVVMRTESKVVAASGGVFEFEVPDQSVSVLEVKA